MTRCVYSTAVRSNIYNLHAHAFLKTLSKDKLHARKRRKHACGMHARHQLSLTFLLHLHPFVLALGLQTTPLQLELIASSGVL